MSEPISPQKSFIVPNTGDLSGAWGTSALNPNFQTLDALFGGTTTISLSSATTILLSVPATTGVWPGFLSQSVNSLITFTGAQNGTAVIQFTLPGFYIINNQCTGTSMVQLSPAVGTGLSIGAIPGKKCHVFFDGTDMDYVNMPDPGTAYDLHGATTYPIWMFACTRFPYLIKDGTVYNFSAFPALGAVLGSTFGGNGITTFAVPDERARVRIGLDTGATNRLTSAANGFNGTSLNASGGTSSITLVTGNLPAYTPAGTITATILGSFVANTPSNGSNTVLNALGGFSPATSIFSGTPQGGTSAPFNNVQPSIVSFLPLIKT